jgi:hypothetical protein
MENGEANSLTDRVSYPEWSEETHKTTAVFPGRDFNRRFGNHSNLLLHLNPKWFNKQTLLLKLMKSTVKHTIHRSRVMTINVWFKKQNSIKGT